MISTVRLQASDKSSNKKENQQHASPWSDFRVLCRYYADCVVAGEKYREELDFTDNHSTFVAVYPTNGWESDGALRTTVDVSRDACFIKRLESIEDYNETAYIGFPCEVSMVHGKKMVTPVFIAPTSVTIEKNGVIYLVPDYKRAQVNGQWEDFHLDQEERLYFSRTIREENGTISFKRAFAYLRNKTRQNYNPRHCLHNFMEYAGLQNVYILSSGLKLKYSKTLLTELSAIGQMPDAVLDQTALAYVFRSPPLPSVYSKEGPYTFPANFISSNRDQQFALIKALNAPCSKIQGPPGTGKSQAAVNLLLNLAYHGRSVLFTSRNHRALYAIDDKIKACFKSCQDVLGVPFDFVQFCSKEDGMPFNQWHQVDLFALRDFVSKLTGGGCVQSAIDAVDEGLEDWKTAWDALEEYQVCYRKIEQITQDLLPILADFPLPLEVNVKSVLKRVRRLERSPKTFLGRWWHRWTMGNWRQARCERKLRQAFPQINAATREGLCARLRKNCERLKGYRGQLQELKQAKERITQLPPYKNCIENAIDANARVERSQLLALFSQLYLRTQNLSAVALDKVQQIATQFQLSNVSKRVMGFRQTKERKIADVFHTITQFYPIWVCTLLSLTKSSPCFPAIFDRVVIDEASQCDIPPIIPALFRAKGVTIVGDPKQFPPVINLPDAIHALIQKRHNLEDQRLARFDYCRQTAYSVVPIEHTLLQEHFRCAPDIASYCSDAFYDGNLVIRTPITNDVATLLGYESSLAWEHVDNSLQGEIDTLKQCLNRLVPLVGCFRKDFSIGIITPFRSLAERLRTTLFPIAQQLKGHLDLKTHVNTVNAFQGGECDLIFLLIGLNDDVTRGQTWYITEQNHAYIYNVAVSRAKQCCIIIGDRKRLAKMPSRVLQRLAQSVKPYASLPADIGPGERILQDALCEVGLSVASQYPLGNRWLDLALVESKIDIEVDGLSYHLNSRGKRKQDDYYRDREIYNLGWRVYRCWHHDVVDPVKRKKIVQEILALKQIKQTS